MPTSPRPALTTIPSSDDAFRAHVERTAGAAIHSASDLEARLRRIFPRVIVRERSLSGEPPRWYVYRDGAWRAPDPGRWWAAAGIPSIRVGLDGWLIDATTTAAGILGIEAADARSHHFTDFIVPGTLDDSMALFGIIEEGGELNATVLLRPLSGDVIAVDLHAARDSDAVVSCLRLAEDVSFVPTTATVAAPDVIDTVPRTDVAFREYVLRAVARMPEPTADGLSLRLRRLYPHAAVEARDDGWLVQRDARSVPELTESWWEAAGLPRVRYDAQAFILEANDAATRFFGHDLQGHHWQEFVTPGSTEQVAVMLEILAKVGAAESRFRMPRSDGTLVEFDSYTVAEGGEFTTLFRPAEA